MPSSGDSARFRILVVDDEDSIRMIVSEVLFEEGYHVEAAENGIQALERVKRGDIQIVISDVRMPKMSGIELLAKVKEFNSEIQVIIMTSHASIDTAIQAIRLGAYDYVTKPFEELEEISTVVARTVAKMTLEQQVNGLLEQQQRRNDELELLYDHTARLFDTLDATKILRAALDALVCLSMGPATAAFYRYDMESRALLPETLKPDPAIPAEQLPTPGALRIVGDELRPHHPGRPVLVAALTWNSPEDQSSVYPVVVDDELMGALAVVRTAQPLESSSRCLMRQYVENVSAQLEKSELYARSQSIATLDGLTGIPNRRHFEKFLSNELERARRFGNHLSLVLFDIDHFKHYNDTNGHPAGDDVLRELARIAQESARSVDLVARYGGEEFVTVLVENGAKGAAGRAESLRALIERFDFVACENQPLGRLTISGGFSTFPECGSTPEELIQAADKALYEAKRAGRNRMLAAEAVREPAGVA